MPPEITTTISFDTDLAAIAPDPAGTIAELRSLFPHKDLFHEIEISGAVDWAALAAILRILERSSATLETLSTSRGDKGDDRMLCRVKGLDDMNLHHILRALGGLKGVSGVTVACHLR